MCLLSLGVPHQSGATRWGEGFFPSNYLARVLGPALSGDTSSTPDASGYFHPCKDIPLLPSRPVRETPQRSCRTVHLWRTEALPAATLPRPSPPGVLPERPHTRAAMHVGGMWTRGSPENSCLPWLLWLGIECCPANQRVASSIPRQGICLGCRPGPQSGACKRQLHIDVSLRLFLL